MEVVRNTFVDIHYTDNERAQAEKIARSYERRGYTLEDDSGNCIQLLTTDNITRRKEAPKGLNNDNTTGSRLIRKDNPSEAFRKLRSQILPFH